MREPHRTPEQLVALYFDTVNDQRLDDLSIILADEFVSHLRIGDLRGVPRFCELMRLFYRAFPEARWHADEIITTANRATVRYHWEGVQRDAFLGIPATHKMVRAEGLELLHVARGQIVEIWNYSDIMGLAAQLRAPDPLSMEV